MTSATKPKDPILCVDVHETAPRRPPESYVVVVTGSRYVTTRPEITDALDQLFEIHEHNLLLVSGEATGVDATVCNWARKHKVLHEKWNANWRKFARAAGPLRNRAMLDAGCDEVLAFPLGESRGTYNCITEAKRKNLPVRIFKL